MFLFFITLFLLICLNQLIDLFFNFSLYFWRGFRFTFIIRRLLCYWIIHSFNISFINVTDMFNIILLIIVQFIKTFN